MEQKKITPPKQCAKHGRTYVAKCLTCAATRFFAGLKALDDAQDAVTARSVLLIEAINESGLSFWETSRVMFGLPAKGVKGDLLDGTPLHQAVDAAAHKMSYTLMTRGFVAAFAEGAPNANANKFAKAQKAQERIQKDGGLVRRGKIAEDAGIQDTAETKAATRGTVEVPTSTEATKAEVQVANMEFATLLNELVARIDEVEKMDRDTLASVRRAAAQIYNTALKEQEVRGYVKPATK